MLQQLAHVKIRSLSSRTLSSLMWLRQSCRRVRVYQRLIIQLPHQECRACTYAPPADAKRRDEKRSWMHVAMLRYSDSINPMSRAAACTSESSEPTFVVTTCRRTSGEALLRAMSWLSHTPHTSMFYSCHDQCYLAVLSPSVSTASVHIKQALPKMMQTCECNDWSAVCL